MSVAIKSRQKKQSLAAAWYRECSLCAFTPTLLHKTKKSLSNLFVHFALLLHLSLLFIFSSITKS